MVRADHEDGGVLNSGSDDEARDDETRDETPGDTPEPGAEGAESAASSPAAPVVRRSSPLGRKPKKRAPKKARSEKADENAAPEVGGESAGGVGDEADAVDTAVVDPGADTSYRDRRVDAQRRRSAREAAARTRRGDGRTAVRIVAVVAGVVVLAAGVIGSILFALGYQRIDHQRELRAEYASFARQVVVQMTTLDPDNADAMYELAMEKTSGRAQQVFRDNMKQVTEMIREGDAVTKTSVLTEAVSEANDTEGTVLMVVGWESRSKDGSQEPLLQTFRYEVGMTHINGELKVTNLEFVW